MSSTPDHSAIITTLPYQCHLSSRITSPDLRQPDGVNSKIAWDSGASLASRTSHISQPDITFPRRVSPSPLCPRMLSTELLVAVRSSRMRGAALHSHHLPSPLTAES